jgi:DNA-binding response OmpR family regulator
MREPQILLVDDERDILEMGAMILREAGYKVQPAPSGDIAMVLIEQGLPFRLLITDIVMPGELDGYTLARRARERHSILPIIYTTGFARVASVRAAGAPWGDTLQKPWRPSDLLKLVSTVLREPAKG